MYIYLITALIYYHYMFFFLDCFLVSHADLFSFQQAAYSRLEGKAGEVAWSQVC